MKIPGIKRTGSRYVKNVTLKKDQEIKNTLKNEPMKKNEIELNGVIYIRKDSVKKGEYTDIKTFEDACRAVGTSEDEFNKQFSNLPDKDTIAYEKLKIVSRAINQDWAPNWDDTDQEKWYPYFRLSSGFGFSVATYGYDLTCSTVGSRLCFENEAKAKYAGTQFEKLYEVFLK